MILEDYGWDSWFDDQYKSLNMHLKAGRVVGNSDTYMVVCEDGLIDVRISDRLFYATASDSELPVPGDWVLIISDDSDSGYSIYDLLPRRSFLALPDEENPGEDIPAAANVDYVIAAVPAGDGLDPSVVENLTDISRDWGAEPIFVCYGKTSDKTGKDNFIKAAGEAAVIFIDSIDKEELDKLNSALAPRKTYALTGLNEDDVSAMISYFTDGEVFGNGVENVEAPDNKARQSVLHVIPSSAIILTVPLPADTAIFNNDYDENHEGDDFSEIIEIASSCRFSDCRHTNEPGCAVLDALDNGELDYDHYKLFLKAMKKDLGKIVPVEQAELKKLKKNALIRGEGVIGE